MSRFVRRPHTALARLLPRVGVVLLVGRATLLMRVGVVLLAPRAPRAPPAPRARRVRPGEEGGGR